MLPKYTQYQSWLPITSLAHKKLTSGWKVLLTSKHAWPFVKLLFLEINQGYFRGTSESLAEPKTQNSLALFGLAPLPTCLYTLNDMQQLNKYRPNFLIWMATYCELKTTYLTQRRLSIAHAFFCKIRNRNYERQVELPQYLSIPYVVQKNIVSSISNRKNKKHLLTICVDQVVPNGFFIVNKQLNRICVLDVLQFIF